MTLRDFDVAILGAGPAGLVAALAAAHTSTVALVAPRLPDAQGARRVDVVPARFLGLLVELGVPPRSLGVERLHERRLIAWAQATPRLHLLGASAHLERPHFDLVLLACVRKQARITIFESAAWALDGATYAGDGWRAPRLLDATGRRAITALCVVRPARPWAVRTFWLAAAGGDQSFALTSLPEGYAYRVAGQRLNVMGFVGRGATVLGPPDVLEQRLSEAGGGWMLAGLPSLASFEESRAMTASVQWARAEPQRFARPVRIGDAAFARDPLSSQGIASSCSEALFATTIRSRSDLDAFESRQLEQRRDHLVSLHRVLGGARFASHPVWREYARFVAESAPVAVRATAALRDGRIVRVGRLGRAPRYQFAGFEAIHS